MVKIQDIKASPKPYFTLAAVSQLLNQSKTSAKVYLSRKVQSGSLLRMRRDLYVLPEVFEAMNEKDLFKLANIIQTPSYVSYLTALSYYGISSQIPQSEIESANPVRSKVYPVQSLRFTYHYCQRAYYFGFSRYEGIFLADPEKALIDSLYLISLGRYAIDTSALDLKTIQWSLISKWLKKYPRSFQVFFKKWRSANENISTA